MPPPSEDSLGAGWWQCAAVDADGRARWLAVVASGRHPGGSRVELPEPEAVRAAGGDVACRAEHGPDGPVQRLVLGPAAGIDGVPPWFAEIRETTARPPAANLVAFTGFGPPPGELLDEVRLAELPARTEDQLGAVRWYPATGEVDQIYVQPAWRRRHVGSALVAAAAALSYARDWPRLWADGQRTELGERFRNASPWRARTAELTNLAAPMTPPAGTPPGRG